MKSIEPASVGGGEFCLILLKKKRKEREAEWKEKINSISAANQEAY